jgi:hypothetical protein
MLLIIAILAISSLLWGERLQVNGGLGWDGQKYGIISQDLNVRALDTYYFQRILPSTVVHFALIALREPLDNQHVVLAFIFLNLGLLLLSCLLYRSIAEELDLGLSGFWFGFIGIFVNFAYFKFAWYYPVLTDVTATSLSLAMLLFYLRRKQVLLVVVILLGAFTWPSMVYLGFVLLMFQREPIVEQGSRLPKWLAAGTTMFVTLGVVVLYFVMHHASSPVEPIYTMLPFSLVLCLLYIYYGSVVLMHGVSVKTLLTSFTARSAVIAATLFVAIMIPGFLWADHTKHAVSMAGTIAATLTRSVVMPLGFVVAHCVYFGPVFLLLMFYWKPFTIIVRNYGLGITLVIWMGVLLSINSESRQNLPCYIMAVPFLGLLVQKLALPARFLWILGALALVYSKVWMRMNLPAYDDNWQHQRFPSQNLFMNIGPWMNKSMYLLQGVIVLVTAVLLYTYLNNTKRKLV